MRVKKYTVHSLPEALKQIKHDLGEDAFIVNTKKLRTGGLLGLFRKPKIEVLAAVGRGPKTPEMLKMGMNQVVQHSPPSTASYQDLVNEIQQLKTSMLNMMTGSADNLPPPVQKIHRKLTDQGVAEEVRSQLLAKLLNRLESLPNPPGEETVFQWAYEELHHYVQQLPLYDNDQLPAMICFVGPTGVGKTTTIAKLAADFSLNRHLKVGFMTADTYRMAAVEQLRSYASILKIPMEVVYSADEWLEAYHRLSHCDIILMDTAGRNYLDEQYIADLQTLFPAERPLQIHLVLSVTAKYEDLRHIVQNFKAIDVDCLTLTKIDETNSYGTVLNLLHEFSIPLMFLTNGQDVPDDLLTATPESIARLIWGDSFDERSG